MVTFRGLAWHWVERLLLAFGCASVVLSCVRSLEERFIFDEAYNLQVVSSLANGVGYASYGNNLTLGAARNAHLQGLDVSEAIRRLKADRWFFDPAITTGPAVLVPLALVWKVTNGSDLAIRLAMLVPSIVYFFCVWLSVPKWSRNGAILGSLLAFTSLARRTTPASVLGDIPSAAMFVGGLLAITRGHPWVAGLAFGLAVQTKNMFLLPCLLVGLVTSFGFSRKNTHSYVSPLLFWTAFVLPTAVFELFRLLTLGTVQEWRRSWAELTLFLSTQVIPLQSAPELWPIKVKSILSGGSVLLASGALAFWVLAAVTSRLKRLGDGENAVFVRDKVISFSVLAASAGLVYLTLWFVVSAQVGYRQGVPGILLLFPALGSWIWERCFQAEEDGRDRRERKRVRVFFLAIGATLCVAAFSQQAKRVAESKPKVEKERDLIVAEAIKDSRAVGFAPNFPSYLEVYSLLTGLRRLPCPSERAIFIATRFDVVQWNLEAMEWKSKYCSKVILEFPPAPIACWPKAEFVLTVPFVVKSWGPQEARAGRPPNPQPGGGGAFWFVLEKPVVPRPVLLSENERVLGLSTWVPDGSGFTVGTPRGWHPKAGTFELTLFDACSLQEAFRFTLTVKP